LYVSAAIAGGHYDQRRTGGVTSQGQRSNGSPDRRLHLTRMRSAGAVRNLSDSRRR
jgi:hypothetical protein